MTLQMYTYRQRPELAQRSQDPPSVHFPKFILHTSKSAELFVHLPTTFGNFQIHLCDEQDELVASCRTVPLAWNGRAEDLPDGVSAALRQGIEDHQQGRTPTALCALAAFVEQRHLEHGYAKLTLRAMKMIAAHHGLTHLVAPVRPSWKSRYPLTPIERYVTWEREDGSPFDPWIRVHWREGGRIRGISPRSMVIEGTVAEWESWTDMAFPESGDYVVPRALHTVTIDRDKDLGIHAEPNVWMVHEVDLDGTYPGLNWSIDATASSSGPEASGRAEGGPDA